MTTNPMRIVHCVRSPVGGIFRHIRDLAASQAKDGHDVGVICDSSTGSAFDNRSIDELRPQLSLGLARFPMKRQLTIQDMNATLAVYRHVRDLKPDVLHGHGAKGGAYARFIGTALRAKGQNVSRIYCPHGGSLHYDPNRMEGRVYHTLERLLGKLTDGFIFVSDYECAAFEAKVGPTPAPNRIVYNGLSPEEFQPIEANPDAADFLFIGTLRDLKGPDLFIEAIYNLKLKLGTAPKAVIVGEGQEEDRCRAMVRKFDLEGAVTFKGPLPARDAFKLAKTVVIPSRAEAMPYIVLESVAAQRPLISTRVGGIPEIFGRFADRLIEPGHIGKLTMAMDAALQSPARMMNEAKELRGCLAESYSIDLMSDRINDFYLNVRGLSPESSAPHAPVQDAGVVSSSSTVYARSSYRQ